jgi:adenylate kinase family enzyme
MLMCPTRAEEGGAVKRLVVLGRGGAGKSTVARDLGLITGLPVIELDAIYWDERLTPLPIAEWEERQRPVVEGDVWIMDGDLGPYDSLEPRLSRADTVLVLDFSFARCAWRSARRSRENWAFWRWLLLWRVQSRPIVREAISRWAPDARCVVVRGPRGLRRFLESVTPPTA